jgi:hypothetical protein
MYGIRHGLVSGIIPACSWITTTILRITGPRADIQTYDLSNKKQEMLPKWLLPPLSILQKCPTRECNTRETETRNSEMEPPCLTKDKTVAKRTFLTLRELHITLKLVLNIGGITYFACTKQHIKTLDKYKQRNI